MFFIRTRETLNSNHVGFWSNESRPAASRHASSLQAASVHTNASASPCVPADTPNPGAYAVAPRMGNEDQEMWTPRTREQLRGCETHAPAVARRTRQQLRGARFEVWNAFIHAAHHTRAQVSLKSSPLSAELAASCWSSSPIRGATDSACLAYADIRQHRFRKRLFARRTQRIVEQAARPQAARVVPQQTHASRTGCSTTDARARDSRYEMLALMLHITHAQNSPNPAGACA